MNPAPLRYFPSLVVPTIYSKPTELILAAPTALLPIRIVAGMALVAVIAAFIYVLRHLKKIERAIVADDLVPIQRGPRNNVVLIICAIPIIIVTLLLFLIIKG